MAGDSMFSFSDADDNDTSSFLDNDKPKNDTNDSKDDVQSSLEKMVAQLSEENRQLSTNLREATEALRNTNFQPPAPTPQAQPSETAEALIQRFADRPREVIQEIADGQIDRTVNDRLSPIMNTVIRAAHDSVLGGERSRVDAEFGPGTFDEVLLPALEPDLKRLGQHNQMAMASRDTIAALVDRAIGQKRVALNERESNYKKSRETAGDDIVRRVVSQLPPSAQPRRSTERPSQEMVEFLRKLETSTGDSMDTKDFMRYHQAGNSLEDYLAVASQKDGK